MISLWEAVKALNEKMDFLIGKLVEAEKKAKPKQAVKDEHK